MASLKRLLVGALTSGALIMSCAPVVNAATPGSGGSVDRQTVIERLPSGDAAAFKRLSASQQQRTVQILSDPAFGIPGNESVIMGKYPEVQVHSESSSPRISKVSPRATGTRSSWISQKWKILFVTYATLRTDAQYQYNGSRAYSIDHCLGSYTNLIPGRQISYYPSYTNNSDGTITCRTNWTIIKAGITEKKGVQGFRVNGNGTFIKKWLA